MPWSKSGELFITAFGLRDGFEELICPVIFFLLFSIRYIRLFVLVNCSCAQPPPPPNPLSPPPPRAAAFSRLVDGPRGGANEITDGFEGFISPVS